MTNFICHLTCVINCTVIINWITAKRNGRFDLIFQVQLALINDFQIIFFEAVVSIPPMKPNGLRAVRKWGYTCAELMHHGDLIYGCGQITLNRPEQVQHLTQLCLKKEVPFNTEVSFITHWILELRIFVHHQAAFVINKSPNFTSAYKYLNRFTVRSHKETTCWMFTIVLTTLMKTIPIPIHNILKNGGNIFLQQSFAAVSIWRL